MKRPAWIINDFDVEDMIVSRIVCVYICLFDGFHNFTAIFDISHKQISLTTDWFVNKIIKSQAYFLCHTGKIKK